MQKNYHSEDQNGEKRKSGEWFRHMQSDDFSGEEGPKEHERTHARVTAAFPHGKSLSRHNPTVFHSRGPGILPPCRSRFCIFSHRRSVSAFIRCLWFNQGSDRMA
jgi:hypothetical protein